METLARIVVRTECDSWPAAIIMPHKPDDTASAVMEHCAAMTQVAVDGDDECDDVGGNASVSNGDGNAAPDDDTWSEDGAPCCSA